MTIFERLAVKNRVPINTVMDACFIDAFEPLLVTVYKKINKKLPNNDGVIYCCPRCGSFDLISEKDAITQGLECSVG